MVGELDGTSAEFRTLVISGGTDHGHLNGRLFNAKGLWAEEPRQEGPTRGHASRARREQVLQVNRAYLRGAEVAELLQVSAKTVARWAKDGKLPYLRTLGGHRRYPEPSIRALVDQLTMDVLPPSA